MCDNLQSICLIIALDKGLTVGITQTKHTIHQLGDTIRILGNALPHILLLIIRQFHIRCRQYLCKTRNDIQRRTYLVGDIADKLGLHLRRDSSPFIGDAQLFVHLLLSDGRTPTKEQEDQKCQHDSQCCHDGIFELGVLLFCLEFIYLKQCIEFIKVMTSVTPEDGVFIVIQPLIDTCCLGSLP